MEAHLASLGEPAYRARQVWSWIHQRHETDLARMTDLPLELRSRLALGAEVTDARLADTHTSRDGTVKLLVGLADGRTVESVIIPEGRRRTACISTQVGCPIGCSFCASGLDGVLRSLRADEILAQYLFIQRLLEPDRLTNLVFMGMGEPLLNFSALVESIERLHDPGAFGFGARRMTVSTVGIAGKIEKLARTGLKVGLALSLHAPTDALRRKLVPYPQPATLSQLLDEAALYRELTGRMVTLEYVLLAGTNDRREHAEALAALVARRGFKVNLIPWNPVARIQGLASPDARAVATFAGVLEVKGVPCTVRKRRGDDIAAACGQLANTGAQAPAGATVELR